MREPNPWYDDVASVDALVRAGHLRTTVRRRVQRGTWREPAPGVICRTTGPLSDDQRLQAALLYGGPGAALSHATAGRFWGLGRPMARVFVTVPHGRNVRSAPLVSVHQSRRPFDPQLIDGLLLTPPARTAIDVCLRLDDLDAVRDVLGRALQSQRATVSQLRHELDLAPSRGSRLPRQALDEIAYDAHAASEARFLRLIRDAGLPLPELNATIVTRGGVRLVDALWRKLARGVEIDGQAYHLSPAAWAADLRRQNDIQTTGITLLRIAAQRLWSEPEVVLAEVIAFLGLPAAA
ncbi:MAG: hypothetical protein QOI54_2378 [Actinomycetota bacterium]|nr:hypothetical protein [Actinomycetota bacterium]